MSLAKINCLVRKYASNWLITAFCFILSIAPFTLAKAGNIVAAEIYCTEISPDVIKVSLFVYNNCNAGAYTYKVLVTPPNGNSFYLKTSISQNGYTEYLTHVETKNVTPVSPGKCAVCNTNCPLFRTIFRSEFEGVIDISKYTGCEFKFSWGAGGKRFSFSADEGIYTETKINRCVDKFINTPRFAVDPFFHACKDQCVSTLLSAYNQWNDSLVYTLVSPMTDSSTKYVYPTGFAYNQPMKYAGHPTIKDSFITSTCEGFYLNLKTGELKFKATDVTWDLNYIALSYMAVKVSQYVPDTSGKNMLLATEVTRPMAIMIYDCNKTSFTPKIISPQVTDTFVCSDNEILLDFNTADGDFFDKTYLDAYFDMQFASFTKDTTKPYATGKFRWKPNTHDIRKEPHQLILGVYDKFGAFTRTNQKLINFYVVSPKPEITFTQKNSGCGEVEISTAGDTNQIKAYLWLLNGVPFSTDKNPVYKINRNGKYLFKLLATNKANCVTAFYGDTFEVKNMPVLNLTDIVLCESKNITLNSNADTNYTYKWQWDSTISNHSLASPVVKPIASRTYIVKAKNALGCTSVDTMHVYIPEFSISVSNDTVICPGKIIPLVVKSTDELKFKWSPSSGISDYMNDTLWVRPLESTTYTVTATDKNGCTRSAKVKVKVSTAKANAGPDLTFCLGGTGVTLTGNGGYFYTWLNSRGDTVGKTRQVFVKPAITQEYYLHVQDSLRCQSSFDNILVFVSTIPLHTMKDTTICQGDTIILWSDGADKYVWDNDSTLSDRNLQMPFAFPSETTIYTVTGYDTLKACSDTRSVKITVNKDCVWPGDANKDGIVNHLDLLEIGVGYNNSGPVRKDANTNWQPNSVKDWNKTTYNNINYKHLDCNGDGNIDAADKFVIRDNYGKVRVSGFQNKAPEKVQNKAYFAFEKDTFYAGDVVRATLNIGDKTALKDAYGFAYTYSFAYDNIVTGTYNFTPVCDAFCTDKDFVLQSLVTNPAENKTEAAIVRTDLVNVAAKGKVADIQFILKDSTHNYNAGGEWMKLQLLHTKLIDNQGKTYEIENVNDSALVLKSRYLNTGISMEQNISSPIHIYPNPARNVVYVESPKHFLEDVYMTNTLGEVVKYIKNTSGNKIEISTENLAQGIYFISVKVQNKVSRFKVIIIR